MLDANSVRTLPRFSEISAVALAWLCEHAEKRVYAPGEFIFLEGDAAAHFFMVLQGEVKIYKVLESGREIILGIFRAGEAIGEVAILDGHEYPANAVAQQSTTMLDLPRKSYLLLLKNHPEVALSFIRDLTLRLRAMRVRVETLSESRVQSRIALLLQSFARELGEQEQGGLLVPVKLNRSEIAAMVGARMETVIRIMSRWQKEKTVTTHKQGFLVEDPDALKEMIAQEG